MVVAARFDLELLQYNVVNAFINIDLDKDMYMELPPRHKKAGRILYLKKVLFSLYKSSLLWQCFFK
jgi:hypothetical protein